MPLLSAQRTQMLHAIKRGGAMTADALVGEMGLSKTAVRAHLMKLEEGALIERTDPPGGRSGRPPVAYRVSAAGLEIFPSGDSELLSSLLTFLQRSEHPELVNQFFDEVWRARREAFERELGDAQGADLAQRVSALRTVLQEQDFMPEIRQAGGRVVVRECNCPFRGAIDATRLPCGYESDFLAQALGGRIVRTEISPQQTGCVFEVETHDPS